MSFNPENVSYTQEKVAAAAAGSQLADGTYKFVVDSTKIIADEKNGNIVAVNKVSPLDPEDGETRRKPSMYLRLTLPLDNGDVPDHSAPDWAAGITGEFLRAVDPENHPFAPRKGAEGQWAFNGEDIDAGDVDEKKLEAADAVFQTSKNWAGNENLFKDNTFFAKVVTTTNDAGQTYTNIKSCRAELASDQTLTSLSEFKAMGKLKVAEKPTNGKASAKPAPAKANGKKGR